MKKTLKKAGIIFAVLIMAVTVVFYIWSMDFYHADSTATAALTDGSKYSVEITDNMAIYRPEKTEAGFIFYPGGKVEYTAYAPLMQALAENNIACIITKMPLNFAVLNMDAADKAYERIADVDEWYIGGHSLGGAMAASYLAESEREFEGLVLLASYSTADISQKDIEVLSLYGSEDKVLNMEKYSQNYVNLPSDTTEIVIDGGNHAQFGSYGNQDGDGTATISSQQQLEITANAILEMIDK